LSTRLIGSLARKAEHKTESVKRAKPATMSSMFDLVPPPNAKVATKAPRSELARATATTQRTDSSLYDYCMRLEAGYPISDGIWEPVTGWLAAERQGLEREDLGSKRNLNRPPNKKMRGAAQGGTTANRSSAYPAKSAGLPSLILYPGGERMEQTKRRFVGIDLAKKSMELCILSEGQAADRSSYKTDAGGRSRLCANLEASDAVAIEACALAFVLARQLKRDVGCRILVLNPGKLAIIWQSTRKTDKEDARKLA